MRRAVSTPLGVALLALLTAALGAAIGAGLFGVADPGVEGRVVLDAAASADGTVELVHRGGPPLDAEEIRIVVSVDGEPLAHQPPVPFFAATGFHGGPTGPFNPATGSTWQVGETASFRVAGTNEPSLAADRTVTIEVYSDGRPVAAAEATV